MQSLQWAMVVKDRTTSRSEILGELDGESRVTSVSLKRVVPRELHASSSTRRLFLLCPLPRLLLWHRMNKNGQNSKLCREAAMDPSLMPSRQTWMQLRHTTLRIPATPFL